MDSAGAYAALVLSVSGLVGLVIYSVKQYIKQPEDIRVKELEEDLKSRQEEVDYLSKRTKELESSLADAARIIIEFPLLKEQVSQLQKEVEELRPRVMEYENLSRKYAELQDKYLKLESEKKELELQVTSYKDILVKAVAYKESKDGTSANVDSDTVGQGSDCP